MAQRHHYLPQFYLRGFADHKERVRVYRRNTDRPPFVASVKKAAVESGMYAIEYADAAEASELEQRLSVIEAKASRVLRLLVKGTQPSLIERAEFAVFLGLQMMRTPESRQGFEVQVDRVEKMFFENMTRESARERVLSFGGDPTEEALDYLMDIAAHPAKYRFVPSANEYLRLMLTVGANAAPVLAERSWCIGVTPGPSFITGDHTLISFSEPTTPPRLTGVGIENAEQVVFPLDRYHVLVMLRPGLVENTQVLRRENVHFINQLVAEHTYQFAFQHPGDAALEQIMPREPRPLYIENGVDIFDGADADAERLPTIFTQHSIRMPDEQPDIEPGRVFTQDEILHIQPWKPNMLR